MKNHKVLLTQVTTILFLACLGSLPVSATWDWDQGRRHLNVDLRSIAV